MKVYRSCKAKKDQHGMSVYDYSCNLCSTEAVELDLTTKIGWEI